MKSLAAADYSPHRLIVGSRCPSSYAASRLMQETGLNPLKEEKGSAAAQNSVLLVLQNDPNVYSFQEIGPIS